MYTVHEMNENNRFKKWQYQYTLIAVGYATAIGRMLIASLNAGYRQMTSVFVNIEEKNR